MKTWMLIIVILVIAGFFRLFYLEFYPPGFYSDEASYGYNALSILKTGQDEHGKNTPLVFEAFGDYKLPVMLYSIVASFKLFSPSDWSARVPGALYGLLTIIAIYAFTNKLFKTFTINPLEKLRAKSIALVAAMFLALAPAHIFASRGTWELTPALCFLTWGGYTLLIVLNQVRMTQKINIKGIFAAIVTVIFFGLSLYSYNSARLFIPLFIMGIAILFNRQTVDIIKYNKRILLLLLLLTVVITFPVLKSLNSPQVIQRAKYISIFYDKGVESRLFDIIRADGGQPVLITRILHNKPVLYFMDFSRRYLSHFNPNFLFVTGDTFEIFKLVGLGFLPLIAAPFLLYALIKALSINAPWVKILFLWLLISPVASSFTIFTPSTSRAMNMIIPLCIFSAYGVVMLAEKARTKWGIPGIYLYTATCVSLTIINSSYIFNQYFSVTPTAVAEKWNDGYKETVEYVGKIEKNYDRVVISSAQAPSYIFYLWYLKYDPAKYHNQSVTDHAPDEHGLNFTSQFGKYYFTKDIKSAMAQKKETEKVLYIGFPSEFKDYTRVVYSRNNKPAFVIKE